MLRGAGRPLRRPRVLRLRRPRGDANWVIGDWLKTPTTTTQSWARAPHRAGRRGGVLHTHNRRLDFYPYVHREVPAAALDAKQGVWRTKARPTRARRGKAIATKTGAAPAGGGGYLFSQTALAKVFRAKVLDATRDAGLSLPPSLPTLWVAHCKAVGDGEELGSGL